MVASKEKNYIHTKNTWIVGSQIYSKVN